MIILFWRKVFKVLIMSAEVVTKTNITSKAIVDLINKIDHGPDSVYGVLNKNVCAYAHSERIPEAGAHAEVSVAEAKASYSVFSANASILSAGVHANCSPVNASAGVSLSLARAEANAGPLGVGVGLNANTGVSVGVDGVSATVLGFGANMGPKPSVKTPFFDFSCTII